MSYVMRCKKAIKAMNDNYDLPKDLIIARIGSTYGNYLLEVETADEQMAYKCFKVTIPKKFRNPIWIKCGDYVLVEPIDMDGKVKGEIVKILRRSTRKLVSFTKQQIDYDFPDEENNGSDYLMPNRNRPVVQ